MCVILGLATSVFSEAPSSAKAAAVQEVYIPYDVEDACRELKRLLPPDFKLKKDEDQPADPFGPASGSSTRPLFMQLNNIWIHGPGENGRLRRYFERKGIYSADLMIGIIRSAYTAKESGKKFSLKDEINQTFQWANGGFNVVKVDEETRPKVKGSLWPAYMIQKDDLNVVHIFCDDAGTPVWCYDHDSGWSKITEQMSKTVAEGKAMRYRMGYFDDCGPVADAIKRMKNPPPPPIPKEGEPDPFGQRSR
jgi:hypothetical protein